MVPRVLVRGSGEVGSAIAHAASIRGWTVAVHDRPRPAYTRRRASFCDAHFDGRAEMGGVRAKRAREASDLHFMLGCGRSVPVCDFPFDDALATMRPSVLVDARMRKHDEAEPQRGLAPLTVGIGPGFEAGRTTDVVVESAWGEHLGNVLRSGRTQPPAGGPKAIGGWGIERFVHAANGGTFRTTRDIAEQVAAGEAVGTLDGVPLVAPLDGWLRGIVRDGVAVERGARLVEVDPSAVGGDYRAIGERPGRIAAAIVALLA